MPAASSTGFTSASAVDARASPYNGSVEIEGEKFTFNERGRLPARASSMQVVSGSSPDE
jgi:hypothetical protein